MHSFERHKTNRTFVFCSKQAFNAFNLKFKKSEKQSTINSCYHITVQTEFTEDDRNFFGISCNFVYESCLSVITSRCINSHSNAAVKLKIFGRYIYILYIYVLSKITNMLYII